MAFVEMDFASGDGGRAVHIIPKFTASTLYTNNVRPTDVILYEPNFQTMSTLYDNWIKFEFFEPVTIKELSFSTSNWSSYNGTSCASFIFSASNDDGEYEELFRVENDTNIDKLYTLNNDKSFKFYKMHQLRNLKNTPYVGIYKLNMMIV